MTYRTAMITRGTLTTLVAGILAALTFGLAAPSTAADGRTPARNHHVWGVIGDSISAGGGATAPTNSYASLAGVPAIGQPGQALAYSSPTAGTAPGQWPSLTETFPAELALLQAQGVNAVVVEIGVNDLGRNYSDAKLKAAYRTIESQGRAAGVRVVLSTITPDLVTTTRPQRQQRWRINQWIRHRGPHVDYARAVGGWNWASSGLTADGVHPSDAGHARMAAALERMTSQPDAPTAIR